jgi:hypothetical protein
MQMQICSVGISMTNADRSMGDIFHQWCTKWLPIIGGLIAIVAAILGGIKYVVNSEISGMANDISMIKTSLLPLPQAISSLQDRATKMETHWEDLKIRGLSQTPNSKESINEVKQALVAAKNGSLKLNPELIKEAGAKFITAGKADKAAWDAALEFLRYRTFLNLDMVPDLSATYHPNRFMRHFVPGGGGLKFEVFLAGAFAPPETAARIEGLDERSSA